MYLIHFQKAPRGKIANCHYATCLYASLNLKANTKKSFMLENCKIWMSGYNEERKKGSWKHRWFTYFTVEMRHHGNDFLTSWKCLYSLSKLKFNCFEFKQNISLPRYYYFVFYGVGSGGGNIDKVRIM